MLEGLLIDVCLSNEETSNDKVSARANNARAFVELPKRRCDRAMARHLRGLVRFYGNLSKPTLEKQNTLACFVIRSVVADPLLHPEVP